MDITGWADTFRHQGYVVLPGVLPAAQVAELDSAIDALFTDPKIAASTHHEPGSDFTLVRLFELNACFTDMLTYSPIAALARAVLGPDYHLIADGVIRNKPGQAISQWHVDDGVWWPVAQTQSLTELQPLPVLQMNFMCVLRDIDTLAAGPTQVVPYSHYSGRAPAKECTSPTFEGQAPVSLLAKAGDIYVVNGQTWHRGAPNQSDTTRSIFQLVFGPRFIAQRFYPYLNYQLPEGVEQRCSPEALRLLGRHPRGPFG